MDSNKDSWVGEKIFRISCNLSASYLKYIKGDLQLEGVSIHGMIDYFINYHFCDLTNDLAKLENSAIKLSVKQQEIIKNCYAIIKQETKLILQYIESNLQNIESNLQNIESTLESPEQYQESKEILSKLIKYYDTIIADEIKLKEQLTQKKETLCKLKNDTMQLYSRPELQELQLKEAERELASEIMLPQFNINDFISDIKSLLSNEQIYDTKQSTEDAGLFAKKFNNYILKSLIPGLDNSISRISKQTKLIEDNIKKLDKLSFKPRALIQTTIELILKDIELNLLQIVEPILESPDKYKESKENLSKLIKDYDTIIENKIKSKEQLTQKKETLCKLKNDTMQLYSRPELQELQLKEDEIKPTLGVISIIFNINNFISDIKSLLSNEQIYDTKQIAKDAGLSTTEFNNYILTSLIPELNHSISRISKQEELNENQSKDVADLTNYITSFKEEILNENKNQSINNTPIDPIPAQKKADNKNVKGNSRKRLKESMCRIL